MGRFRMYSGHGWSCSRLDAVANDPLLTSNSNQPRFRQPRHERVTHTVNGPRAMSIALAE
jgi:hypothetical protein